MYAHNDYADSFAVDDEAHRMRSNRFGCIDCALNSLLRLFTLRVACLLATDY